MYLLKTGTNNVPTEVKWNETLFVDIWNNYALYTECSGTTFKYRLETYIQMRKNSIHYFNENYVRQIIKGKH
jgi:hypothetical protein